MPSLFLMMACHTYVAPSHYLNPHWLIHSWTLGNIFHWNLNQSTISHPWWYHQMETFSVLLALCEGNTAVTGGFPSQRPVTQNFDVFVDLRLNKQMSKQLGRRWFEMPSSSLWHHCNAESESENVIYKLLSSMCHVGIMQVSAHSSA